MPLIGATQGQHNWWTKGLVGSKRTLRNWTGGWITAESVAQEGRKVKPILPTTASRSTDRTTRRTNLTTLKPAEDDFFSFFFSFFVPSFPLNSFFLSVLLSFFIPSSFHPLPLLFLLPAFFYLFCCFNFCQKIPSYLASDLSLFLLPSFLSFSIPFFLPSILLLFFLPPFLFRPQVRQENLQCWKDQSKTVLHTHKPQLKTSEHRRLGRQHHWIPLAFNHRNSNHKPRESDQINLRSTG